MEELESPFPLGGGADLGGGWSRPAAHADLGVAATPGAVTGLVGRGGGSEEDQMRDARVGGPGPLRSIELEEGKWRGVWAMPMRMVLLQWQGWIAKLR